MIKKIYLISLLFIISLVIYGCREKNIESINKSEEVKDTGVETDITESNYQIIFINPGDVLQVALKGKIDSGYQWSFREPTTGNFLILNKHTIIQENDSRLGQGEFISDWKFKVIKTGIFDLRLDYENPTVSKEPAKIFKVRVYSGQDNEISDNIILDMPKANDVVNGEININGYARVFEAVVSYRLKDEEGKEIFKGTVMAKYGAPIFGYFEKNVKFNKPSTGTGILEVYQASPRDGSEIDLVTRPVVFDPNIISLKVFFNNNKLDPEISCEKVFPVNRYVAKTTGVAQAALDELLKGLTQGEKDNGYSTSLPEGDLIKIKSIKIENGKATVDFNQALQQGVGGSCRVSAIRAQIIETLKQFSTIQEVSISVDGKTEDILQP